MPSPTHPKPFFLGLDASTQALKASLLSNNLDVIDEAAVNFDADIPRFGTSGGVLLGQKGSGEVYSPIMMVVEAMDLLMDRIKQKAWPVGDIRGVAAAGQQHASVYWSRDAPVILSHLDHTRTLASQLDGAFASARMPNWQDSSTTKECRDIEARMGGPERVAEETGSKAHERFTGPQIMKLRRNDRATYDATFRISLCSSFITTLLCVDGEIKGIDESDACGMNLWQMNTTDRGWHKGILQAIVESSDTADLESKLGAVETDGGRPQGPIGKWYQDRYGFSPECLVFPGTGDNPATFLSLTLKPSEGLVSLGTSDVVLVSTSTYNPDPEYHAFFHPAHVAAESGQPNGTSTSRYFNMLVYKNGSLARQHVRDKYFAGSWDKFNQAVDETTPSIGELPKHTSFWWLLPEIIPSGADGVHKYVAEREGQSELVDASSARRVDTFDDVRQEARTILESAFCNYRSRASSILHDSDTPAAPATPGLPVALPRMTRVYATGGASVNRSLLSVLADVMKAPICKNIEFDYGSQEWKDASWNSCSVGVAYKAKWGWERHTGEDVRRTIDFDSVVAEARKARGQLRGSMGDDIDLEDEGIAVVASPGPHAAVYEKSLRWWQALERRAVEER
ncbi:xylulokinase [Kockovaella imperatae]|uniref:Xylulose kinase n=1 Tax=Kockovaella imperatae TaxID=4999 RepID=A0A1Y1U9U3_9TREE|nr:xylulokinase [Kockovaella imperatae]ORX34314.1 xylulokinase [Kockovaella imperatae]